MTCKHLSNALKTNVSMLNFWLPLTSCVARFSISIRSQTSDANQKTKMEKDGTQHGNYFCCSMHGAQHCNLKIHLCFTVQQRSEGRETFGIDCGEAALLFTLRCQMSVTPVWLLKTWPLERSKSQLSTYYFVAMLNLTLSLSTLEKWNRFKTWGEVV